MQVSSVRYDGALALCDALVNQCQEFEFDAVCNCEPMAIANERCNMVMLRSTLDEFAARF